MICNDLRIRGDCGWLEVEKHVGLEWLNTLFVVKGTIVMIMGKREVRMWLLKRKNTG